MADFAHQHSLVERLLAEGLDRVLLIEWRSASPAMRYLSIDSYLADLGIALEDLGGRANLVGLCQGGWMALVYAARFPAKVRKLVLAGAPIDTDAGSSRLSAAAHCLPFGVFEELTRLGDGRLLGQRALELWEPALQSKDVATALQLQPDELDRQTAVRERFRIWSDATVDLPGVFYRQSVLWLFKENRLAEGRFVALGRQIDLGEVRQPLFLVSAQDDDVVPSPQLMAVQRLVGTRPEAIESLTTSGNHLSLFFGGDTLRDAWGRVAHWLSRAA